jgi:hypothetical protein
VWNMRTSRFDVKVKTQVVEAIRAIKPMRSTGADQLVVALKSGKPDGAKGLSRSAFKMKQPQGRISWRK